ncbi:hypothetical protein LSH36_595g02029 [Paralvinella palmiformis]|uniref:SCP domain-containing protein n=1 Tax=Paralvinella palmiformis TaxID=53620 RepID=A0AAD9J651_9ANNE|nr:hypothetical protein LSH36_595g02029 [Paralvinella palmiformis]
MVKCIRGVFVSWLVIGGLLTTADSLQLTEANLTPEERRQCVGLHNQLRGLEDSANMGYMVSEFSLSLSLSIYIYIYIYICVCVCVYPSLSLSIYLSICRHVCVCVCVCVCDYLCLNSMYI